jgi:hypothetical protein
MGTHSGAGGIIALALAMQDAMLDVMTDRFVNFATETFSRPNAGDVLIRLKTGHMMTKMFMAPPLGFTRTMLDSAPLRGAHSVYDGA